MSNKRFCLTVTGESLRNLTAIRIKDHHAVIERQEKALGKLRVDLVELEKIPAQAQAQPQRRIRSAPRPLPGMLGGYVDQAGDVERDIEYVENQIKAFELALFSSQTSLKRTQWLHDNIVPSGTYELGTDDMAVLGFAINRDQLPINDCFMV